MRSETDRVGHTNREHLPTLLGGMEGGGSGQGALSDPALPGHDEQPAVEHVRRG
jgi:hypothetical protein